MVTLDFAIARFYTQGQSVPDGATVTQDFGPMPNPRSGAQQFDTKQYRPQSVSAVKNKSFESG